MVESSWAESPSRAEHFLCSAVLDFLTPGFAWGQTENPRTTTLLFQGVLHYKMTNYFSLNFQPDPGTSSIQYGLNKPVGIHFQWILGSYLAPNWNYACSFDGLSTFWGLIFIASHLISPANLVGIFLSHFVYNWLKYSTDILLSFRRLS